MTRLARPPLGSALGRPPRHRRAYAGQQPQIESHLPRLAPRGLSGVRGAASLQVRDSAGGKTPNFISRVEHHRASFTVTFASNRLAKSSW